MIDGKNVKTVLFLCTHNSARSQMAEGFARMYAPSGIVEVASAGTVATEIHPVVFEVMGEMKVDISGQYSKTISELGKRRFDLVITLCDEANASCPVFPGSPAVLHWSIKDPAGISGTKEEIKSGFARTAEEIRDHVYTLFKVDFFFAFVKQKENLENLLESLSEGILAHDLKRKIFFFSRGAEKITGFRESEVLGRDCHEVFTPSLCGENCSFCEAFTEVKDTEKKQYPTVSLSAEGVRKEYYVSVFPLKDENGTQIGVVTSFSDRTDIGNLRRRIEGEQEFQGLIGQDYKMQRIYNLIRDLGQCDFPVVISGESGTGKELVARAIHRESPRRDSPFIPINCGALPEGTLESELFGHVKGAFTGAIRDKKGRFELADGGTLFLDEVAELSQAMQVKLLRVLQEGTFEPVGSEKTVKVDVRIISATNKNLKEITKRGEFREDLYYRISVVPVEMPPLREKRNDIPVLAQYFLDQISSKLNRESMVLSKEALNIFMSYSWPGNVRQLQNAIQYSMIMCREDVILPEHLPPEILKAAGGIDEETETGKVGRKHILRENMVLEALRKAGGNKAKAARILGVGRATLYNFIKERPYLLKEVDDNE